MTQIGARILRNSTNDTDMKIYILQENYSYTDYEAGWDEN